VIARWAAAVLILAAAPACAETIALPGGAIAYRPDGVPGTLPLLVLLHGAGQGPGTMIEALRPTADARGIVLLAPAAHGVTWDVIRLAQQSAALGSGDPYRYLGSPDGRNVADAIAALPERMPFDRARIALAGFSDGATFALALGTDRAATFGLVAAWSPGLAVVAARPARGRAVVVAHGRLDGVLAFDQTANRIVPMLRGRGLAVRFVPFRGQHVISAEGIAATLDQWLGPAQPSGLAQIRSANGLDPTMKR
jgi:phospholipase/carboxylesterase